jgi:two-component system CheB/CheR fusion protein
VSSGAQTSSAAGANGQHFSILIVEDHEDTARAISKLLAREGYTVRVERTIAGAMAYCSQSSQRIDLLIADITLPDGDGWELLRQLTQICLPFKAIAFSGHGMPDDLEKSKKAGFVEHLTKPVMFQDLLAAISRVMERSPVSSPARPASPRMSDSGVMPAEY